MKRITESPEHIRLGKIVAEYDHPHAICYAVVNNAVVYSEQETHPVIFNALKRELTSKELDKEYDIQVSPTITDDDYAWFDENYVGVMSEMRQRTHAGRAWKDLVTEDGTLSALSFWDTKRNTPQDIVDRVIHALGLDQADDTFVEFIDSKRPQLVRSKPMDADDNDEPLHCPAYPELTEREIIDVLVKSHTDGYSSLNQQEKDIVDWYRGSYGNAVAAKAGGYDTPAEFNFRKRFGDALCRDTAKRILGK